MASRHDSEPLDGEALISCAGMTVSYGRKPAVFSVDATFPGAMTAIIGPNGAGKSTLLKACLGISAACRARWTVFGQPLEQARHRIAYVPQRASVDWDFPTTVLDVVLMGLYRSNLACCAVRTGTSDKAHCSACLDRVGMAGFADRQIGQLSGGQQQRVFLARVGTGADLYLLDEPFAGVDAATENARSSMF
jgi:manganese/zinc/iron transport system ATP- binding protein